MLIFVSELELLYIMYRDLMYRFEILLFFFVHDFITWFLLKNSWLIQNI